MAGPTGDISDQRVTGRSAGEESQGVSTWPPVLSSASELSLEFHKDNCSQQQRHI